jgi:lipopolysaccharide export system permease protein
LKIIDRYIIKKFLGTFVYALVLILIITIVFDVSEKIDTFIDKNISIKEIVFDYYLNWIPYFANLYSSLFVFVTVIFFTSKMATHCEIIAILSNGVSYKRFLWPYFVSSFVIAVISLFLNLYIIPPANKIRLDFDNKYLRNPYYNSEKNIHRQIEPGVFIYMQSYSTFTDIGYKFSLERFEGNQLKYKLISNYIKWDSAQQKWTIYNYYIREIEGRQEKITTGRSKDTTLNMNPLDFKSRADVVETMTLPELNNFIRKAKLEGQTNIISYQFDKHSRFAYPFAIFVLTLIGVTLSSQKKRGGTGLNLGLGLMLSFSYILFMRFSQMFALGGTTSAFVAAWIPNILYLFIGLYLYYKVPK